MDMVVSREEAAPTPLAVRYYERIYHAFGIGGVT